MKNSAALTVPSPSVSMASKSLRSPGGVGRTLDDDALLTTGGGAVAGGCVRGCGAGGSGARGAGVLICGGARAPASAEAEGGGGLGAASSGRSESGVHAARPSFHASVESPSCPEANFCLSSAAEAGPSCAPPTT